MTRVDQMIDSRALLLLILGSVAVVFLAFENGSRAARSWSDQLSLEEQMARSRELDQRMQLWLTRLMARRGIAQAVITGEITLLEAAAYNRVLDQQPPMFDWQTFRAIHAGNSDEERHCREVIVQVENELDDDPCLAAALREQLLLQLEDQLKRGPLRLPKVTTVPSMKRWYAWDVATHGE